MASIQGIYVALFGRPVDPAGLAYWEGETKGGTDLSSMISLLSSTDEYQSRFEGQTDTQILTTIYTSLFGRAPDTAGLTYFLEQLSSGAQTIETIAVNVLDGAKGDDAIIIEHKVAAADLFTASIDTDAEIAAYKGDAAADAGRSFVTKVGLDASTVPTQEDADTAVHHVENPTVVTPPTTGGGDTPVDPPVVDTNIHVLNGELVASEYGSYSEDMSSNGYTSVRSSDGFVELGISTNGDSTIAAGTGSIDALHTLNTPDTQQFGFELAFSVASLDDGLNSAYFELKIDTDASEDGVIYQTYVLNSQGVWANEDGVADFNINSNVDITNDNVGDGYINRSLNHIYTPYEGGHFFYDVELTAYTSSAKTVEIMGVHIVADVYAAAAD